MRALIIKTIITTTNIKGWWRVSVMPASIHFSTFHLEFHLECLRVSGVRLSIVFSITVETRSLKGRTIVASVIVVVAARLVSVVPALRVVVATRARIRSLTWV